MIIALAILAREPIMICLRRLLQLRRSPAEQATRMLSLPALRAAVLGHSKQYITRMFGPPPTTTGGPRTVWYYPLHEAHRVAMAISFHNEEAVLVEFFQAPLA